PPPVSDGGTIAAATGPASPPSPVFSPSPVSSPNPAERPSPIAIEASPDPSRAPRPRIVPPAVPTTDVARPASRGPSAAARAGLQRTLDRLRAKYGIPGVSTTIIFADGSAWTGVSGLADVEKGRPVTHATAFAIGSISKTFTAALVLAIGGEGKIVLDAPVKTYVPNLRIDPKTTVRQLLDHTSGLRDYFFHPRIDALLLGQRDREWDETDALRYVGKPYFKPGAGWHYSNTNYLVLGLIAEAVGAAPIDEQIRTRFLEPLGLGRTFYQGPEHATGSIAHGYRFKGSGVRLRPIDLADGTGIVPFRSVVTAAAGAGSLASNSADVARWARSLYGGAVLPELTLDTMLEDRARTAPDGASVPYGLGVQVVDIDGRPSYGHSGRLLGFRSVMRWLPEEGITIVVLTNQSRTDPALIARALLKQARTYPIACGGCAEQR
nr:serine hydrolase [Chloroflexota bacterium]